MPDLTVEFRSKHPHHTLSFHLSWRGQDAPADLLNDLRTAGWTEGTAGVPPFRDPAMGEEVHEVSLWKPGSGLFRGWTPEERKRFTAEARRDLKRHGLTCVPHRKLTLADLL